MKKITFLIVALFISLTTFAQQKGEKSLGLSLGYGTDIESLGIGAHFNYNILDKLRLAPNFTYFFKHDNVTQWDLNMNVHYLVPLEGKLTVYPIAGFVITHWSVDTSALGQWGDIVKALGDTSQSKFGINIGGGIQYDITKNLFFNGELKYSIVSDFDQAVVSVGLGYKF